jgi:TonB family protein
MNFRKNQALWTSVILHLVVLIGVFLATIVETFRPKEKLHVFEMVDMPSEQSSQVAAADPLPPLDLPELPELPPVPEAVIPQPQPKPKPKPAVVTPKPKPKIVNYEDFLKSNPIKDPTPRQTQTSKPINVPKISTPRIKVPSMVVPNPSDRNLSSAEQDALARYGSQLNARLNRSWIKPANLAGVRLVVEVAFDVSASGRISNVRLRPSSGNSTFDRSVLAAFAKVSGIGATPTGQAHTFRMTFKMVD